MALKITIRPGVAMAYVVLATVWLGFSNSVMEAFIHDREFVLIVATIKDWLFVLGTILALSWMATHGRRQESSTTNALRDDRERVVTVLLSTMQISRMNWGDNSGRMTHMVEGLARLAGLRGKTLHDMKTGAQLRDVGRLAIPQVWRILLRMPCAAINGTYLCFVYCVSLY